ncbi:sulfatase-like hydrolase/transferase [Mangrovimonas sp. YM274]|uniref:sulfatase-like hydrolase/transferase n=1 Tax=Mangrovimonas sp. YM274 TaxID=3070660 RepID=UPI0027DDCE97|nr:sulfatase-like hydrolase/transferase [Mangrovimonas sp. YM274]WMI68331.1 sulfatase-like hydrolase/transferase [Mangrovimonas sp. YM274]
MKKSILTVFLLALCWNMNAQKISIFDETVVEKENMEPAIPRPEQENIASQKLKDFSNRSKKKPNVLIFLVDDLGWGDIGCNGGGVAVGAPTPNVDKLAREGKRFTSFYSTPTCTSSRAALMTGRQPIRSGLTRPLLSGDKVTTNPWDVEVTQAKLLSSVGYKSALIGKWHIGEAENMLPHEVGFDYFYGLPAVQSDYTQFLVERQYSDMINNKELHDKAFQLQPEGLLMGRKGGGRSVGFEIKTIEELRQIDEKLKDESIKFIKENSGKNPFYLIHSFTAIHNDTYCGEDYIGKSPAAMPVKDAILQMDHIVGEIMQALKDSGELENTLVLFTSDNGANEDVFPDSGYHPWKGGKGTTWEGGVRVPLIAYWKDMIEPGQETNELIDLTDLYMVSLRLGGVMNQLPNNLYFDGIDQTSYLLAKDGRSKRQCVFLWNGTDFCAMRWKDYKVHFQVFDIKETRRNIDATNLSRIGTAPWCYNLNVDPKEMGSEGHRYFEWGIPAVNAFRMRHLATMKKYPNTDIGLGL